MVEAVHCTSHGSKQKQWDDIVVFDNITEVVLLTTFQKNNELSVMYMYT